MSEFGMMLRALRSPNYRLFFAGQTVSLIGTWMERIAIGWLVFSLTNSAFFLGYVGFAGQMPTFLLTPFAGVVADRWNRHRIMIVTQVLAMIQAFALAILVVLGTVQIWHVVALSILLGIINAFDMPTRQAFVIDIIERREDLANAIALNSLMVNGARLIGPSLAGVLIGAFGLAVCFLINAFSFVAVIAALLAMHVPPPTSPPEAVPVWEGLRAGFRYTFGFQPIRAILLLVGLVSLMGMPYTVLMPVFASDVLHGGPYTLGFLMAASGVGALVGAVFMASRRTVLGLGKFIPIAAAVFGLGLVGVGVSRTLGLALLFLVITGLGMMVQLAASNTILQTIVDESLRGRVLSFYTMAFIGTAPFGSLLGGVLAEAIGTPNTFVVCGAFCVLGALLFARELPALRARVRPIYARLGIIPEVATGLQQASLLTKPPED